jgi:hypothetical protein
MTATGIHPSSVPFRKRSLQTWMRFWHFCDKNSLFPIRSFTISKQDITNHYHLIYTSSELFAPANSSRHPGDFEPAKLFSLNPVRLPNGWTLLGGHLGTPVRSRRTTCAQ